MLAKLNDSSDILHEQLTEMAKLVPTTVNPTTRDWAGFFKALLALLQGLIPLIDPLVPEPKTK